MEIDMSFASLILAIIAIILIFVFRRVDSERIVDKTITKFEARTELLLERFEKSITDAKIITTSQSSDFRPDTASYFTTQWRFLEKVFHNRYEKHDICRKIVRDHIGNKDVILLDSGSTVDLVTYELLSCDKEINVDVYSNNVVAAMHLVETKRVTFHLFSGRLSERYAAVYDKETNSSLDHLPLTVIILAATAIRAEIGIMVRKDDNENKDFKLAAINFFKESKNCKLIIAVDSTKMIVPFKDTDENKILQPVMDEIEWKKLLETKHQKIVLVTSTIPRDINAQKRVEITDEIKKFRGKNIAVENFLDI